MQQAVITRITAMPPRGVPRRVGRRRTEPGSPAAPAVRPTEPVASDVRIAAASLLCSLAAAAAIAAVLGQGPGQAFGYRSGTAGGAQLLAVLLLVVLLLAHVLAEIASYFGQERYTPLHGGGPLEQSDAAAESRLRNDGRRGGRTVAQLKVALKARGLLVGGKKAELLARLLEAEAEEEEEAHAGGDGGAVPDKEFYEEYNGHKTAHLERVHREQRRLGCEDFVFLCGDSSLDNKHWFFQKEAHGPIQAQEMSDDSITAPALNGYEVALSAGRRNGGQGARMAMDVAYWFNRLAAEEQGSLKQCTIMASVEASTAADRHHFGLLPQDEFIRDKITSSDCIVMSIGGNDVALAPTLATGVNMVLLNLSPDWLIWLGLAPGLRHFNRWFHKVILSYIRKLVAKTVPRKVVVNMIYFPDQTVDPDAWPANTLRLLGYDANPAKLQYIIRALFTALKASSTGNGIPADLRERGLCVEAYPLYTVLDGNDSGDYEQRVEPSVQGGRKIARALLPRLAIG